MSDLFLPSYEQGFASSDVEPEYPNLRNGAVGHWLPLLGPNGLVVRDESGNEKHASLTNIDPAVGWVTGPLGYAVDITSTAPDDEALSMGQFPIYTKGTLWTVQHHRTRLVDNKRMISAGGGSTEIRGANEDSYLSYVLNSASVFGGFVSVDTEAEVIHLALTWDGVNAWAYLNGEELNSISTAQSLVAGSLLFGNRSTLIYGINGLIYAGGLWNRALTQTELQLLYRHPGAFLQPRDGGLHVTATITVNYTRAQSAALGTDETDLGTAYSASDYTDVDTDNAVRVGQIASDTNFAVHLFKDFVGSETSATLTANVQSDLAPSSRTVYLQVYNYNSTTWENVDSENIAAADTDFDLTGNIADLTNYKSAEFIACRVYQANA